MKKSCRHGLITALVIVSATGVLAQEAAPADKSKLEKKVAIGATLTDGNSETMNANGSLIVTGEKDRLGSFKAGIEGNYGENTTTETRVNPDGTTTEVDKDETTISNAKLFGTARKTLSPMTFAYLDGSLLNDDIAEIDYRGVVGPGLGMYLVKDDNRSFLIEGGVTYLWEEVQDVEDDYAVLRLAEACEHKFANGSRIWQSVVYMPKAEDFDIYLLNAEIGVEAPLQGRFNLRLVLQDRYDSDPGEGIEYNDLTLIAGLSFNL